MKKRPELGSLITPPRQFFMTLKDIGYWARSARADAALQRFSDKETTTAFDNLYATQTDPYGSALDCYRYQRLKYERLSALLPARRYASGLDIGCGLGVYTRLLAPFADRMLGLDYSEVAVKQAQELSKEQPHLRFAVGNVMRLEEATQETFDLIILADVLYYVSPLTEESLDAVAASVERLLAPGGILLLTHHYFFRFDPHSRETQRIHAAFHRRPALEALREAWRPFYLGSVFEKRSHS